MATLRAIEGVGTTAPGSSLNTGSLTPDSEELIVAVIMSKESLGVAPEPTLTGNSLTYTSEATVLFHGDFGRITVFSARGASPTTGAITISWGGNVQIGAGYMIWGITGAHVTTPLPEIVTTASASASSLTATLATLAADALALAAFAIDVQENQTHESGWTEAVDAPFGSPGTGWQAQSRIDGLDASCTSTWTTAVACAGVIIEVANAESGGGNPWYYYAQQHRDMGRRIIDLGARRWRKRESGLIVPDVQLVRAA